MPVVPTVPDATVVAATVSTIRRHGIAGATLEAIAHTSGVEPADLLRRFGSLDALLVAAARAERERLAETFSSHLDHVNNLAELATTASELHTNHAHARGMGVLAQLLAGSATSPELRDNVRDGFEPWIDQVRQTLDRVLEGTAAEDLVSHEDLAYAVAALFLGIELISTLDDDTSREDAVFRTLAALGGLGHTLLNPPIPGGRAAVAWLAHRLVHHNGDGSTSG